MEEKKYRNISLRREFVDQIEEFIKTHPEYSTVTDFINEAARSKFHELKKVEA
jgi:hypothetical protein